ncbi:MAG: prepilin-type N-terminal cleavage/methylation domain-containing protein, partial [Thioalkalivibrio sp.]|nr:prepilin-type N-terminal cleavage/methylation domain-containing protein [Thioalkalivibrio sp.]
MIGSSKNSSPARKQQGFTLVEMAIVLAVIGLILGAIALTTDIQRNAEYTKIANKFLFQWKQAYDQHYQRAGVVLGDCEQAPTYMVNGGEAVFGGENACERQSPWAGGSGEAGLPENHSNTGLRVCNGQGYDTDSVGAGDPDLADQNLRDLMLRAGVSMPPGRGEGFEDRYVYEDSNGNAAEVQVCYQWNPPGTSSGSGNVMVVRGLTPDLARFMDQLIDGKADAREGAFRMQDSRDQPGGGNPETEEANSPGFQWSANNTVSQDDAPA